MAWRLAESLRQLRREIDATWPGRDKTSDGSIGDLAHSSRVSDHNPDDQGVVRAIDVDDNDPTAEAEGIGRVIAEHLRARKDPRVKYVIYHGRMFSSYRSGVAPAWTWRPYTGANAHKQHLHISVVADARADDTAPWGLLAPRPPAQEDDMTPDQAAQLARIENTVEALEAVATRPIDAEARLADRLVGLESRVTAAIGRAPAVDAAALGRAVADAFLAEVARRLNA